MKKLAIFMLILIFLAHAENYVVINSNDGRDILTGIYYAHVKNITVKFMPKFGSDSTLFASKVGSGHDIFFLKGEIPVSGFLETTLRERNNTLEVYTSTDPLSTNLELARLSGAKKFIVVDSAFSDGALSVLPYAAMTDSYVLLSNDQNADEVKEIVRGAEQLMVYGLVDHNVRAALSDFNPEYIGKGEDKYEDNIEIVKRTVDEFSLKRVIIVDGTFIEEAMADGETPIVLCGKLVPKVTYDFFKESLREDEVVFAMLIGNELVTPIHDMRDRITDDLAEEGYDKELGVVIKFAQAVPSAGGAALVLDTFPLPAYKPELVIKEIVYNDQSETVMLSVDNVGQGPAYFTEEIRVRLDGMDYSVLGGNQTTLIERGQQLGVQHPLDLSDVEEGNLSAVVVLRYGASKTSLEEYATYNGQLTTISFVDQSNISAISARYGERGILVTIKNNDPDEEVYVFSKLGITLGGSPTSMSSPGVRYIEPNSLIVEEFPVELSAADLEANKFIDVTIDHGSREGFLVKTSEYNLPLEKEEFPWWILLLLLLILLIAAYYYYNKSQEKPKSQQMKKPKKTEK